ncbi:VanW family protein [Candidatus Chloroploca sp. Khr17]|uniref:VanW family protein n=1 Tax=Candidatus Chloroploca sp. Khr17 TaxID=2496869 RepID=UPI00101C5ECA|nr:VanW family protein [Candidatus Chloroploca sp. Khr17]
MYRYLILIVLALALLLPSTPLAAAPAANPQATAFTYFPETGHNVGMQIKQFFDTYGGVAVFGLPLTELIIGADGRQVQYFEYARFEYNPTAPLAARVTLTRAGAMVSEGRADPAFQWMTGSADPERDFYPESGHTLGGAFRWFWQSNGGVPVFGYPISEELYEQDDVTGTEVLVQYFERARLEYHPATATEPDAVRLTPVGRMLLQRDPVARAATAPVRAIELLGRATTGFAASSYERVTNVSRATEMVHGMIVPAGAEFSFNSIGDFSEANGFVDGYAIVGGRLERVIGGGLCQVSTTLFRAVSYAGLQITRRVGHSHIVNFYENILGFDATVFVPSVDFRWRNDSPGPVYLVGITDLNASQVSFEIYGINDGRKVVHQAPITRNWKQPGVAVWQYDASLPQGAVRQMVQGRAGVDVTLNRVITLANGRTRTDAYVTRYAPWEDFFLYGPGVTPPSGVKVIAPRR